MKRYRILYISMMAAVAAACAPTEEMTFGVDTGFQDGPVLMGPAGGSQTIKVTAPGDWVVITEEPWITVSPANGRGAAECKVSVDSTLLVEQRKGAVRIQSLDASDDRHDFSIVQEGFEYQIALEETSVDVAEFADYDSRYFEVKVKSNIDFDVVLPEDAGAWLSYTKDDLVLDRGARPRETTVRFDWRINSRDVERIAEVKLQPKEDVTMGRHDALKVVQKAAQPIPVGTPAGDSLAVLAISRALNSFTEFDTAEKMEHWNNVAVWKEGPNKGRVKYVQFFMFNTKESLPFEVQYLTAAEEIVFYSNANQFLKSLDTGEYITKLTQLKRLTIGAYGLTTLHPDFVNLKNLEYLDLSSNCFQTIPEILTEENFPNLHALVLNANQRNTVYDLSNDTRENIGGFIDEPKFPVDLLKWSKLDTLRLSVNYLQGALPDLEHEPGIERWTAEEVHANDTLPDVLIGLPKVLPNTNFFAINSNRLTGELPKWLLYHPKLDMWMPYSLIFTQEGKTREGKNAGFVNEPTSLDYYYDQYVNKKFNPNKSQN
ncbi:MAG: hypothetical protein E7115_07345 [Bacteroidales bacterium]|nr:hypothetical protein [Bacteroidales bacterium]